MTKDDCLECCRHCAEEAERHARNGNDNRAAAMAQLATAWAIAAGSATERMEWK